MRTLLSIALLMMAQPLLAAPSKYALLVGITKYDHPDLNKAEFTEIDTKDVGDVFKDAGYTVDLLLGKDATQAAIKKKLAALDDKGDSDGVIVLGFLGMGLEYEDTNETCFCPVDTRFRNAVDSKGRQLFNDNGQPITEPDPASVIKIQEILAAIGLSPAGSRLLLMDCNRDHPNRPRARAFGKEFHFSGLPRNTAVLFACSQYEMSYEHPDWGHGAFAKCLIEELRAMMKSGRVTVGALADRVQFNVKQLVAQHKDQRYTQTPQFVSTNVFDLQMIPAKSPSKYALFVGVTKYDHAMMNDPALAFPENDAEELADLFKSSGYTVETLLGKNATKEAILKKLADLKDKGDTDGVIVLGFFGHGVEFESTKQSYFCPFDTKPRLVRDSKGQTLSSDNGQPLMEPDPDSLVSLSDILAGIRISPAGDRLLLMDCNRTQPNKARGFGSNVRVADLPDNTVIMFACSQHEKSFEHADWKHGAFAKCLLDELRALIKEGHVTVGVLADRVRQKVKKMVADKTGERGQQTPKVFSTGLFDLQMKSVSSTAE